MLLLNFSVFQLVFFIFEGYKDKEEAQNKKKESL